MLVMKVRVDAFDKSSRNGQDGILEHIHRGGNRGYKWYITYNVPTHPENLQGPMQQERN